MKRTARTPALVAEAKAWYALYLEVGTFKTKARELGIHEDTLRNIVYDIDRREQQRQYNQKRKVREWLREQAALE